MKLNKSVKVLLASGIVLGALTTACGDTTSTNDGGAGSSGDDGDSGDDGAAAGPECDAPGTRTCTGSASGIVCAEGSTAAIPFFCAEGEVCEGGDCVGQCEGGATECVGESAMRVCSDDGRQWVEIACREGTSCADGTCTLPGGLVCTPGEKSCTGTASNRTCKNDGSGWEESEECPGDSTCSDGECVGSVCVVGASRCDSAATEWAVDMYDSLFFEGPMPDLESVANTVYRCVDGSEWVVEPCADESMCTYTSFSASDVAAYQAETSSALWEYALFEGNGSPPYAPPIPPEIPANSTAECTVMDCPQLGSVGPANYLLFGQQATQVCGDVSLEVDEAPWASSSVCHGMPIFSPMTSSATSCGDELVCMGTMPSGGTCRAEIPNEEAPLSGGCYPGEIACVDADTYRYCAWNTSEGGVWSSSVDCPLVGDPGAPGACSASGEFPSRTATCAGDEIELPPLSSGGGGPSPVPI